MPHSRNMPPKLPYRALAGQRALGYYRQVSITERENAMDLHQHLRLMSEFHLWAFERLYTKVDQLDEADYRRDIKLFFGSVHATLNHILLVDHLWQARLKGSVFAVSGLDAELEPDRTTLRQRILEFAQGWKTFVCGLTAEQIAGDLAFRTMDGEPRNLPFASLIGHVFNHATHHRGQVTAALTQLGQQAPVLDLPYFLIELPRERLHKA
jgi:uncharacterized damage-inducible protein DinB